MDESCCFLSYQRTSHHNNKVKYDRRSEFRRVDSVGEGHQGDVVL